MSAHSPAPSASTSGSESATVDPRDRARFFSADNNFDFAWPEIPAHQFVIERDRALASDTPTGFIDLDISDRLGTTWPATTPTLLMRYLRLRDAEPFDCALAATGVVYYVLSGRGRSSACGVTIEWAEGDLFCFPGGELSHHVADGDALLYLGSNEPLLAFSQARPPAPGESQLAPVHWTREAIEAQLEEVYKRPITEQTTGHAVLFTSPAMAPTTNALPTINIGLNTLEAGRDQRPHRHNGVAVVLCLQGQGVHSMVDGERIEWQDQAVQITPPTSLHSHHNRGNERMRCLIFQDEALHYYTRTPGFSFD
ncbi:MAG: cupin domain-containing protein [Gammaproteobacteria bacterium]|nr:cupin domain-containing protein [Gammaproteobacteria bacterium]